MQYCPLEANQIASVMDLYAQNCKIYNSQKLKAPPGPPGARALILQISSLATKLNLYPKNSYF